jgi:hypothetical protein
MADYPVSSRVVLLCILKIIEGNLHLFYYEQLTYDRYGNDMDKDEPTVLGSVHVVDI